MHAGDRPAGASFASRSAAFGCSGAAGTAHPVATLTAIETESTRRALIQLGWPMGASDGGFGRYECIEHRMNGADRVYAAASEMRADGMALAY